MTLPKLAVLLTLAALACVSEKDDVPARADDTSLVAKTVDVGDDVECLSTRLTGEGVGALRIGLPVDSAARLCTVARDTIVRAGEGQMARKITVADEADTVVAEIVDAKVWRLEVTDAGIRTADSLGVGSSLGELLRIAGVRRIAGEGRVFVVAPSHCGLSFQLDVSGAATTIIDLKRLPAETRIERVLVIGCGSR
jgi:hypothetical protein